MEEAYRWLVHQFGISEIKKNSMLIPTQEMIPISFPIDDSDVTLLTKLVADRLNIDQAEIKILFYEGVNNKIEQDLGNAIHLYGSQNEFCGLYNGINNDGFFEIIINRSILKSIDLTISTLAHECVHILLSGKIGLENYDEYLTDLTTVFFGLGIFSANAAFIFYKSNDSWGYSKSGYLNKLEWGYALALYDSLKNEKNDWVKFLEPTVKKDYLNSKIFVEKNLRSNWFNQQNHSL